MLIEKPKEDDIRMKEANVKRGYVRYTVQDKVRFFDLKIEKCMSTLAAAKQLDTLTGDSFELLSFFFLAVPNNAIPN
ncbi:hypothetical protein G6F70_002054 [Rhizopus microsporus]|nr:hypothetical protein G6F71_002163 [Rhizopus microsporus]KAG1202671.1 hypothetical protein G6F70_002054 [Rhizopus microsporus]KAG1215737.1 hypothetical protein G6F69_000724 [Rhizopus microsporus]KAG1236841.1 hypothetical protein G6F67_001662 [Rhizopus microsporus]KAG1268606.1 hypothetical protein G6F68_000971 [Rhizopus microsporus]